LAGADAAVLLVVRDLADFDDPVRVAAASLTSVQNPPRL
jgi:hypothetical protein